MINKIVGKRETPDSDWKAFMECCVLPKNGLLALSKQILRAQVGDNEGGNPQEKFNYLMLDSLKKNRKTDTNSALTSALKRRERSTNINILAQSDLLISPIDVTIQVVIVDHEVAVDKPTGHYYWATACKRQLVTFKHITIT